MDLEARKNSEKALRLVEENNKLLHKLYRANKWRFIFKTFYWIILIALSLGAYYFIQPYIEPVFGGFSGLREGVESIGESLPGASGLFDTGTNGGNPQ